MNLSVSDRRLAENEVYFRNQNEQVEKELAIIRQIANEEGKQDLVRDESHTLFYFLCECSDENCQERIGMTLTEYSTTHQHRGQFVLLPGHAVSKIEQIILKKPNYWVVEKFVPLPDDVKGLNSTPIQNT